jgi:hypothetical protein
MVSLDGHNIKVGASNCVGFNIRTMEKVVRWRQLLNAQVGGKNDQKEIKYNDIVMRNF